MRRFLTGFLVLLELIFLFEAEAKYSFFTCDSATCTHDCKANSVHHYCDNYTVVLCDNSVNECALNCEGADACDGVTVISAAKSTEISCDGTNACFESRFYCGDMSQASASGIELSQYSLNLTTFSPTNSDSNLNINFSLSCAENSCDRVYTGCYGSDITNCNIDALFNNSFTSSTIDCDLGSSDTSDVSESSQTSSETNFNNADESPQCVVTCDTSGCRGVTMLCDALDTCTCDDASDISNISYESACSDVDLIYFFNSTSEVETSYTSTESESESTNSTSAASTGDYVNNSTGPNVHVVTTGNGSDEGYVPSRESKGGSGSNGKTSSVVYVVVIVGVLCLCCCLMIFMYVQWNKATKRAIERDRIVQNENGDDDLKSMEAMSVSPDAGYRAPLIRMNGQQGDIMKFHL